MAISLQKGQKISLTKDNNSLSKLVVGLGWDEKKASGGGFFKSMMGGGGASIDCDASVILCKDGKLQSNADVIFFANLTHETKCVRHMGDNLTGAGDGDDEQIKVDLNLVPADYNKIVFVVNIYQCIQRKQNFGMIQNAFIRIVDENNGTEICRYSLTDDYSGKTALVFGEVYRAGSEWKFSAIGEATTDPSIKELIQRF